MKRFRIVHRGGDVAVIEAASDLAALKQFAASADLDQEITGTYRLPGCEPDAPYVSPYYAVEVRS